MLLHKAVVAEAAHPSVFVSEVASQQLRPGNFPKKLVPLKREKHALGNLVQDKITGRSSMPFLHHKLEALRRNRFV